MLAVKNNSKKVKKNTNSKIQPSDIVYDTDSESPTGTRINQSF